MPRLAALGAGIALGLVGAVFTLLTSGPAGPHPQPGVGGRIDATFHYPGVFVAGLLTAVVCVLVGAAVGALCNPPLLRHPAAAALATLAVVIVALAADVSPANAALRHGGSAPASAPNWPGAASLAAAAALLAVTWTASTLAATRRERSLS